MGELFYYFDEDQLKNSCEGCTKAEGEVKFLLDHITNIFLENPTKFLGVELQGSKPYNSLEVFNRWAQNFDHDATHIKCSHLKEKIKYLVYKLLNKKTSMVNPLKRKFDDGLIDMLKSLKCVAIDVCDNRIGVHKKWKKKIVKARIALFTNLSEISDLEEFPFQKAKRTRNSPSVKNNVLNSPTLPSDLRRSQRTSLSTGNRRFLKKRIPDNSPTSLNDKVRRSQSKTSSTNILPNELNPPTSPSDKLRRSQRTPSPTGKFKFLKKHIPDNSPTLPNDKVRYQSKNSSINTSPNELNSPTLANDKVRYQSKNSSINTLPNELNSPTLPNELNSPTLPNDKVRYQSKNSSINTLPDELNSPTLPNDKVRHRSKNSLIDTLRNELNSPTSPNDKLRRSQSKSSSINTLPNELNVPTSTNGKGRRSQRTLLPTGSRERLKHRIPVGPTFQADLPDWTGRPIENGPSEDSKWLGAQIWPAKGDERKMTVKVIGKGIQLSCKCKHRGSVSCIKHHVRKERLHFTSYLGPSFDELGFNGMGEEVARSWTEEERAQFENIVRENPLSEGRSFLEPALQCFGWKTRSDIVSYYYNVFLLRKMSMQSRKGKTAVDSSDDEAMVIE